MTKFSYINRLLEPNLCIFEIYVGETPLRIFAGGRIEGAEALGVEPIYVNNLYLTHIHRAVAELQGEQMTREERAAVESV